MTPGLQEKHGPDRVFDTPISELAMTGAAYGAAITGKRPVLEIMFGDFLALSMDTLINQATKYWFLTGGEAERPARDPLRRGRRRALRRDPFADAGLLADGITGLKIVAPATPADAKGLLKAAIRDENPCVFLEHKRLYSLKGEVGGDEVVPLGRARVAREGRDITLVTAMKGVHDCQAAAETLAADHGIDAEVVDLRTLRPIDLETVLGSVAKTNRVVIVEEGPLTGGWAGEMLALIAEHGLSDLDDAWRIATPNTPIPYSPPLEDAHLPGAEADRGRGRATRASEGLSDERHAQSAPADRSFEGSKVGSRLRAQRERVGISLRELARRVGVSPSLVSQIELDRVNPLGQHLYSLVTELGMTMSDVFGDSRRASASSVPLGEGDGLAERAETRSVINLASGVRWERLTAHSDREVEFLHVAYPSTPSRAPRTR